MKEFKTKRGFSYVEFEDGYGLKCKIQESSAVEPHIWLGVNKPKLTVFEDENMGKYHKIEMPKQFIVDSEMHLSREDVAKLLPYLNRFVETGDIM